MTLSGLRIRLATCAVCAGGGYRPGDSIERIQSKTDNVVDIAIVDRLQGEVIVLYPELEAVIGSLQRGADDDQIVRYRRTGAASAKNGMNKLHRRIRRKAGMRDDLKFTSFRHGGIIEFGDSGKVDVRAVGGHKTLNVTGIFYRPAKRRPCELPPAGASRSRRRWARSAKSKAIPMSSDATRLCPVCMSKIGPTTSRERTASVLPCLIICEMTSGQCRRPISANANVCAA